LSDIGRVAERKALLGKEAEDRLDEDEEEEEVSSTYEEQARLRAGVEV
jgi:hypothetical protein